MDKKCFFCGNKRFGFIKTHNTSKSSVSLLGVYDPKKSNNSITSEFDRSHASTIKIDVCMECGALYCFDMIRNKKNEN